MNYSDGFTGNYYSCCLAASKLLIELTLVRGSVSAKGPFVLDKTGSDFLAAMPKLVLDVTLLLLVFPPPTEIDVVVLPEVRKPLILLLAWGAPPLP